MGNVKGATIPSPGVSAVLPVCILLSRHELDFRTSASERHQLSKSVAQVTEQAPFHSPGGVRVHCPRQSTRKIVLINATGAEYVTRRQAVSFTLYLSSPRSQ